MSKALNASIGVGSNKRVVNDKSNILMSAIHITQKDLTRKFRKFCKDHQPIDSSDSEIEVIINKPDRKKKTKEPKAKAPELKSDSEEEPDKKEPESPEATTHTKEPDPKETISDTKEPETKEPETKEPESEDEVVDAKEPETLKSDTKEEPDAKEPESEDDSQEKESDVKDESEKEENLSVLESIQIYKTMLKGDDIPSDILLHVSCEIQRYLDNCPQALIALKYVPMDKSRIKMLLDIMEYMHPEIQN
jgi:hypothetical protein